MRTLTLLLLFIGGCARLPEPSKKELTYSFDSSPNTKIYHSIHQQLAAHPNLNGFYPLGDGEDALAARLAGVLEAERTLDLQYYIWHDDETGRALLKQILKAADRGVRVRLLLDDLNEGKHDKGLLILDAHPYIEVRLANPFAHRKVRVMEAFRFSQVNRRMHNKVFIADNQIGIFGGRNIGNEYFGASDDMNFGDFDLWTIGPVVKDLSEEFDTYWNSDMAFPVAQLSQEKITKEDREKFEEKAILDQKKVKTDKYAERVLSHHLIEKFLDKNFKLYWGKAHAFYDAPEKLNPDKKTKLLVDDLRTNLNDANKELILISPYFVPGKKGMKTYKQLRSKGVDTWVLTNSLASNDVTTVFSGYRKYRKPLIKKGVNLYELMPRSNSQEKDKSSIGSSATSGLHGKLIVFDQKKVVVGSMNLDPRSKNLNTEMGIVVESPEMARDMAEKIKTIVKEDAYHVVLKGDDLRWETVKDEKKVKYDKEPETTWWKRFKANLSAIFVPEKML